MKRENNLLNATALYSSEFEEVFSSKLLFMNKPANFFSQLKWKLFILKFLK